MLFQVSYLKKNLKNERLKASMQNSGDAISKIFLEALVRLIGKLFLLLHQGGCGTQTLEIFVLKVCCIISLKIFVLKVCCIISLKIFVLKVCCIISLKIFVLKVCCIISLKVIGHMFQS